MIHVLSSMATRDTLAELARLHAGRTGKPVRVESVGGVDALKRVQSGEAVDCVVLASGPIDQLIAEGRLVAATRTPLADSGIGLAVRRGERRPPIATADDVRAALLAAPSVGYSTGPSGNYLRTLLRRLDIAEAVEPKLVLAPPGVAVGKLVARGDAAIGLQQISELIDVDGADLLGPLPPSIQSTTTFVAAATPIARDPAAARELLGFLASPHAAEVKRRFGMAPPG